MTISSVALSLQMLNVTCKLLLELMEGTHSNFNTVEYLNNCISKSLQQNNTQSTEESVYGIRVYAYVMPVIFVIGIIGNMISLYVFSSRPLRLLSGSVYLSALSTSDLIVLLIYILLDWLNNGLPFWPGGHRLGVTNVQYVCQLFLYISYMFR